MAKYSDEYRAKCIALLSAEGYPQDKFAVRRVWEQLQGAGQPAAEMRTLRYWFKLHHDPAPANLIRQEKSDLANLFEQVVRDYVTHALKADVIQKTSGKDALVAAGIAAEKMRLLQELPTEIIAVLSVVQDAYRALAAIGEDPESVFRKLAEAAEKRRV